MAIILKIFTLFILLVAANGASNPSSSKDNFVVDLEYQQNQGSAVVVSSYACLKCKSVQSYDHF